MGLPTGFSVIRGIEILYFTWTVLITNVSNRMKNTQLSPGIILMSGGVHDGGIIQSSLFTSRNQNLVSGKLWRLGFWSYSKFVK